jgi:hypothetical protein
VLVAHLWLVNEVAPAQLGDGAAPLQPRFEVAFVRTLAQAAPPAAPPQPAPRPQQRLAPLAPAPAASAATAVVQAEPLVPEPLAALAELAANGPEPAPLLAPAAAASASAAEAFEWPPSTRLSYTLTGNVRGPVDGQARVEWLRSGTHYQVFMEASVGPSFAPLFTRRDSSEGEITAAGLSPRRYDLQDKVVLRDARLSTIFLDADRVRLSDGTEVPRPAGVQDAVSQFVHLTWLFTLNPALLTPGSAIELPLALPRRVENWTYDVLGVETLYTPAGPVDTVHVKPRREAVRGGDYTAEIWVAPTLQYLPVRIVVRQNAENFIDLQLERLPEQAAHGK